MSFQSLLSSRLGKEDDVLAGLLKKRTASSTAKKWVRKGDKLQKEEELRQEREQKVRNFFPAQMAETSVRL